MMVSKHMCTAGLCSNSAVPRAPPLPINTHEYLLFLPFEAGQGYHVDNQLMANLTFKC